MDSCFASPANGTIKNVKKLHDKSNTAASRITPRVERGAILQLLSHACFSSPTWISALIPTNTKPPRVSLFLTTPTATIGGFYLLLESAAAWIYWMSLLLLLKSDVLSNRRNTFLLKMVVISSFIVLATTNVNHIQPPILHGLALLMANSNVMAARIVLSATWFWSGLHKVNPNFLSKPSNRLVDPVYATVLGGEFVQEHRLVLRLVTAFKEACAGLILLTWTFTVKDSQSGASSRHVIFITMARVSVVFLVSMHCIIVVRLLQLNWNHQVLGWNINCLYLVISLWRHDVWQTQKHGKNEEQTHKKTIHKSSILVGFYTWFIVCLPVLVMFGALDPYLGSAVYTDNSPSLVMELPGSAQATYDNWGLFQKNGNNMIMATTHDGRHVVQMDSITWSLKVAGSVGYPSVWAHKQLSREICALLHNDGDARFFLQYPYTGKTLFASLWWLLISSSHEPPPPPLTMVLAHCLDTWKPVSLPLKEDKNGGTLLHERDYSVSLEFSATTVEHDDVVELFWVNAAELQRKDAFAKDNILVPQGLLQRGTSLVVASYTSHLFVATARRRHLYNETDDSDRRCCLAVWIVVPSVAQKQKFVVTDPTGRRDCLSTIAGLQPCGSREDHVSDPPLSTRDNGGGSRVREEL